MCAAFLRSDYFRQYIAAVPYRQSRAAAPKRRARSAPVLDELVKQFSDRYAFLRELVQNAIDAGATRVRVGVTREADDRTTFVEDDGSGMTLDVIKGPFLTKFSSSKEGDASKIGRYGVGFLSVFALEPRLVVVDTEAVEAHSIRLEPTFAFEVATLPASKRQGTRVAIIERAVDAKKSDAEHLAAIEAALLRWCRYAAIRIELDVGPNPKLLNVPFSLIAPVTVELESDGLRVIVGPAAGTAVMPGTDVAEGTGEYAGFYSRGLTLVEATSGPHAIEGLRYRVESPKLSHTISRDDVVHDDAYARAKQIVRELGGAKLRDLLEARLSESASRSARAGIIDAEYSALRAAGRALLKDKLIPTPLAEPPGSVVTAATPIFARANASSPLTKELHRRGSVTALDPSGDAWWLPASCTPIEQHLRMVEATIADPDAPFGRTLLRVLPQIGIRVELLLLASTRDTDGRAACLLSASCVQQRDSGSARVFLPVSADDRSERALLLFTEEPSLQAVLSRLPPERAALLAARLVWLEDRGELPRRVNLALLEASVATWAES